MADRLRPLANENRIIARGQIFGRKRGDTKIRNFGDHTGIKLNLTRETAEDWSNDTPVLEQVGNQTTKKGGKLDFGLKQWTPDNQAMIFKGDPKGKVVQAAITNHAFSFEDVADGDILELLFVADEDEPEATSRVFDVTTLTSDGWVEAVNYRLLNAIGLVQVIKAPSTTFAGTFSAATSQRRQFGLMNEGSWIGEFWINQIHDGPKLAFYLPYVDGGAEGEVEVASSGTEYSSGSMSFAILADYSQPAGFEHGTITELS